MRYFLEYFSKVKAGELFLILVLLPLILVVVLAFSVSSMFKNAGGIMTLPCLFALVYWTWIFSIGIGLARLLDKETSPSYRIFYYGVISNYFYIVLSYLFYLLYAYYDSLVIVNLIKIGGVVSMLCTIYCISYLSRLISKSGFAKDGVPSSSIITFLSILYYPVGLWYIQPKIIKILSKQYES